MPSRSTGKSNPTPCQIWTSVSCITVTGGNRRSRQSYSATCSGSTRKGSESSLQFLVAEGRSSANVLLQGILHDIDERLEGLNDELDFRKDRISKVRLSSTVNLSATREVTWRVASGSAVLALHSRWCGAVGRRARADPGRGRQGAPAPRPGRSLLSVVVFVVVVVGYVMPWSAKAIARSS